MIYFLPPHTILEVGKNHDLGNKKWVTPNIQVHLAVCFRFPRLTAMSEVWTALLPNEGEILISNIREGIRC